jgi:hypothetical protein
MSGCDDRKISLADVLPFLLIGCMASLFLGGAVWMVPYLRNLPPPHSWNVGSVVRTELHSNLEEKQDLTVGFATNGHAVFVPSSSTRLEKQTLVMTEQWQFLVDGHWLLARGVQLEVRERTAGPQLCVKAERACYRFHQSAQLQANPASDSPDEVSQ